MKKSNITIALVAIVTCVILFIQNHTNFYEVSPGTLYRSCQLDKTKFERHIYKYGIKTVINLRGALPNEKWYQREIAAMQKNNVKHIDFCLSATQYVSPEKLDSLITLASNCPKPILVHCKRGADRTGLFCSAWQYKVERKSAEFSSKQLSIFYGHFPWLGSKTRAMDSSFHEYAF